MAHIRGRDMRWVCIGALLAAAPARAGTFPDAGLEAEAMPYRQAFDPERSPVEDILPPPVPVRFSVHFQASYVNPSHEAMQLIYGNRLLRFGATFGYYVTPSLVPSVGLGFIKQAGEAVGKLTETKSGETTELLLFPLELGVTWRFHQLSKMLIPFVTAGLDLHTYREEVGENRFTGGKWGWHARAGLAFRIDSAAPRWSADAGKGIQATSLVLEGGYSGINNFGQDGLDFSGLVATAGLGLEF